MIGGSGTPGCASTVPLSPSKHAAGALRRRSLRRPAAWVAATLFLSTGCQFLPGTDASFERAARDSVMAGVLNPASAQFKHLRVVRETAGDASLTLVCGLVNVRGRAAEYEGFTPFAYVAASSGIQNDHPPAVVLPLFPTAAETTTLPKGCDLPRREYGR